MLCRAFMGPCCCCCSIWAFFVFPNSCFSVSCCLSLFFFPQHTYTYIIWSIFIFICCQQSFRLWLRSTTTTTTTTGLISTSKSCEIDRSITVLVWVRRCIISHVLLSWRHLLTYIHTYLHKDMIFVHLVLATPISLLVLEDICLVFSKEKKMVLGVWEIDIRTFVAWGSGGRLFVTFSVVQAIILCVVQVFLLLLLLLLFFLNIIQELFLWFCYSDGVVMISRLQLRCSETLCIGWYLSKRAGGVIELTGFCCCCDDRCVTKF
jgi:hypothetical protein